MHNEKTIISSLSVIAIAIMVLSVAGAFVMWKLNSYTVGNWRVEYDIREVLEDVIPELNYEIVSRKLYETKFHGIDSMVWEFTIKCDSDDKTYTVYDINRKTNDLLYWNIADYSEIYFDYDERIMDDIDESYAVGDYRVSIDHDFVRSSRYEFSLSENDQMDDVVEKISNVYDFALGVSKGYWPVDIVCVVNHGDKEIGFFTRDFYSKGKITMDKSKRTEYIRDKFSEL